MDTVETAWVKKDDAKKKKARKANLGNTLKGNPLLIVKRGPSKFVKRDLFTQSKLKLV